MPDFYNNRTMRTEKKHLQNLQVGGGGFLERARY